MGKSSGWWKRSVRRLSPERDYRKDASRVQVGAGEQFQLAEHGDFHFLGFVHDQHRPVKRCLDLGLPLFSQGFSPVPTVVRRKGHLEQVPQLAVKVRYRGLGTSQNADHNVS